MFPIRAAAAMVVGLSTMFGSWGFVLPSQNPTDTLILVNKTNKAPTVPVALVKPNVTPTKPELSENIYMQPEAAKALEVLFSAAEEDGLTITATSGYRSYSTQQAIWKRKLEKSEDERAANASVAKPGYSEHQTGLAMDIEGETTKNTGLNEAFGKSPEGRWIAENCWDYGFILRYPEGKRNITGYIYEPWHIRYIGVEDAQRMHELDITFEEYIVLLQSERIEQMEKGGADDAAAQ